MRHKIMNPNKLPLTQLNKTKTLYFLHQKLKDKSIESDPKLL